MTSPIDLEAIRARHAAATAGPYRDDGEWDTQHVIHAPTQAICNTLHGNDAANAVFLSASWQDVSDLLAEVDRLRAEMKALEFLRKPASGNGV